MLTPPGCRLESDVVRSSFCTALLLLSLLFLFASAWQSWSLAPQTSMAHHYSDLNPPRDCLPSGDFHLSHPRHLLQRLVIHPHAHPLIHHFRPQTLIKIDARLIPLQHAPLQPLAPNSLGFLRQFSQEPLSVTPPPVFWPYKKVF